MTSHDSGVADLLRRASDDLAPDVDRLVRDGIARGRTRQRHARIGTTLASLAVVGVVGGLAVVVPLSGTDGSAAEAGVASGAGATSPPTPTATPAPTSPPRVLAIAAPQIPDLVTSLFPGTITAAPERTGRIIQGGPRQQIAHFLWNGTLVSVGATRDRVTADTSCAAYGDSCDPRPDGSNLWTWQQTGPEEDGGVTGRGVSLLGADGWKVFAISYNSADGKGAPLLTPEPPLSYDDLEQVVTSGEWFG